MWTFHFYVARAYISISWIEIPELVFPTRISLIESCCKQWSYCTASLWYHKRSKSNTKCQSYCMFLVYLWIFLFIIYKILYVTNKQLLPLYEVDTLLFISYEGNNCLIIQILLRMLKIVSKSGFHILMPSQSDLIPKFNHVLNDLVYRGQWNNLQGHTIVFLMMVRYSYYYSIHYRNRTLVEFRSCYKLRYQLLFFQIDSK